MPKKLVTEKRKLQIYLAGSIDMGIKDKDGKPYKLRGPNPIMITQKEWDCSMIKLFNMDNWESETIEDEKNLDQPNDITDIGQVLQLVDNNNFIGQRAIPPQEFVQEMMKNEVVEKPVQPPEPVKKQSDSAKILKNHGVQYFCSPVVDHRIVVDELYGTSYKKFIYGDKFLFNAIIVEQTDLVLQIWCMKTLLAGSVIYKRDKQGGERWWRVKNSEVQGDGFLVTCDVSDVNPDFS